MGLLLLGFVGQPQLSCFETKCTESTGIIGGGGGRGGGEGEGRGDEDGERDDPGVNDGVGERLGWPSLMAYSER